MFEELEQRSSRRYDREDTSPQHPMFVELGRINKAFDESYYEENLYRGGARLMKKGSDTIQAYIATIKKYQSEINPEMLVARENRFSGNIDPVFAFLIRGICGPEMITPEVFDKVRDAWCGSDIPNEAGEILKIKDDKKFLREFNKADFDPSGNVKLTVLRWMDLMPVVVEGIAKLLYPCQEGNNSLSRDKISQEITHSVLVLSARVKMMYIGDCVFR